MANQDFNIDDLKKSWQEQTVTEVYGTSEIEAMLNKKSRNYVKYIFWISLAEFLFFAAVSIYTIFTADNNESFLNMMKKLGLKITQDIEMNFGHLYFALKIFSLLITAGFVLLFYRNYKKIKVECNLKNLIVQIIKFKKTVNAFILTNIILLILIMFALTFFTIHALKMQNIHLENPTIIGFYAGIIISLSFGILLVLIYYRVVYGIIMRRLGKNLEHLQKIEQEQ